MYTTGYTLPLSVCLMYANGIMGLRVYFARSVLYNEPARRADLLQLRDDPARAGWIYVCIYIRMYA